MHFITAITERYRRRETNVREAMIEMYPPAVSTKYVKDMGEALWEASVSTSTALNLNEKAFESVDRRLGSPLERAYPYVYGMYPKCAWGDAYKNVSIMDTIGINDNGYCKVIGVVEGFTEPAECRRELLS